MFSWLAEGQELKKVRMGSPAFSLTFLTFFVAKDASIPPIIGQMLLTWDNSDINQDRYDQIGKEFYGRNFR
jgi:hypothetical protein